MKVPRQVLVALGCVCVALATLGMFLPLLPTTPLLILALALFSKSSPRFHHMLRTHHRFGPILRQWEENRSLERKIKIKATVLIVLSFSISLALLHPKYLLQILLITIASTMLTFIWRLPEG